jgi:ribonuclease P protein component
VRDHSFSKCEKLKKKHEFKSVFSNGESVRSHGYKAYYLGADLTHSRIGIIISKRHGSAVVRNYEKRIIREFYRLNKADIPPVDIVIIVTSTRGTFSQKESAFKDLVSKIRQQRDDEK